MAGSNLTNRRILVTGGAGFIGSHLAEQLLKRGNEVMVLDNFSTGKRANLAPFADHPRFTLIEGDIRDREACRRAAAGMEFVLHQAALGSVPRSVEDPVTTTEVNITGFVNLLFAAKEAGVKRFVYASSSSVYGDNAALPKHEEETGRPLSPYAITKCVNELYAENFFRLYGIETIGLRYFNVFGPRQDPEGAYAAVIPRFTAALFDHQSPVINGDGSYSRDFTYVDNVVEANLLALLASPEAAGQACNIACGGRLTLSELFTTLREAASAFDPAAAKVEPEYGPERAGDIPHSHADISRAGQLLGYRPRVGIREGLFHVVEWYAENR